MTRNVATVLIIQAILKRVIGRRFTDKRVEKVSWCCDGFCAPPEQFKCLTQISGGRGLATLIWRCALPPPKEFRVQSQRLFYFHLTGIPIFNYIRLDHGKNISMDGKVKSVVYSWKHKRTRRHEWKQFRVILSKTCSWVPQKTFNGI